MLRLQILKLEFPDLWQQYSTGKGAFRLLLLQVIFARTVFLRALICHLRLAQFERALTVHCSFSCSGSWVVLVGRVVVFIMEIRNFLRALVVLGWGFGQSKGLFLLAVNFGQGIIGLFADWVGKSAYHLCCGVSRSGQLGFIAHCIIIVMKWQVVNIG